MDSPLEKVRNILKNKGYLATAKLNEKVGAVEINSPNGVDLYHQLKTRLNVSGEYDKTTIYIFDSPDKVLPVLEAL